MGFVLFNQRETKKMKKEIAVHRRELDHLNSKMTECDTQHLTHAAHNRRHDDAMNGLTEAVKELTGEIRGIKKKEEIDDVTLNRTKNNYTAWDTIIETSKQVSAIVGAGALLISAGYGILKYVGIIS